MKKDLAKTICICKGCDYLIMSDGSFQFEHKERN